MMTSFLDSGSEIKNGNICCCCLGDSNLQNLALPDCDYCEIYSDMMHKCYGVQIIENDDSVKDSYFICDICVMRLKDAFSFKLQIEMSYESLQKYMIRKNFVDDMSYKSNSSLNRSEHNFDDDSYNYTTNLKTEELLDPSINKDIEHNEIQIKKCSIVCENIDIKLKKQSKPTSSNVPKKSKNTRKFLLKLKPTSSIEKPKVKRKRKPVQLPYKLDENDVTCKICNETFVWQSMLKRHMSVHFPNYICDVCGKSFVTETSLQSHARCHIDTDKITCKICNKVLNARNLYLHMRCHNNVKCNKCTKCPERFATQYEKIKHLIAVHNDEPNKYKCHLCPKRYILPGRLNNHIRNSHLNERNYKCAECSRRFFNSNGLKNHMLTHTGVKNFQCDVCKKCFVKRYTLSEHMKIHNNVKNFICNFCNKAFTQKCTLKAHIKMHEKETEQNSSSSDTQ